MDIKINNLNKFFKDFHALKNINFSINNINSLRIIGSSGGGKPTLLRILTGLLDYDSGKILINNTSLEFSKNLL